MKKMIVFLRRVLFLILTAAILIHVNAVFERKTITQGANYSIKVGGFVNEPENSFDVMGFGSSHMYCTLNPLYLYEQTGIRSYVFATQQQPVSATYYYIKEALKTQKPDVIIVEALMFAVEKEVIQEGVAHDAIDSFPESMDKLRMIMEMNQEDAKEHYFINFMKYHSRWKELKEEDFTFEHLDETDPLHGYVFLGKSVENHLVPLSYEEINAVPLREDCVNKLLEIQQLAKENDVQMLLLFSPFQMNTMQKGLFKSLHAVAEENGIDTLDMNVIYDDLDIDATKDYYDAGHFNVYGAEKASIYIGEYIMQKYGVSPGNVDDGYLWAEDLEFYHARKVALEQ